MTIIHGVWDQERWIWYVEPERDKPWCDQLGNPRAFSSADSAQRAWWRWCAKHDRRSAKLFP